MSSLNAYIDLFYRSGSFPVSFADLVEECELSGRHSYLGYWVADPHRSEVGPYELEDHLPTVRLDELYDGAEPTETELALRRERKIEARFKDSGGLMVAVYQLEGEDGHVIWGATLHGDHGMVEESYGPYKTEAELEDRLRTSGNYRKD